MRAFSLEKRNRVFRYNFAVVLFAFLLIGGACSFEEPQAPKWDVAITIPLINRYYTMQDLMEDEPSLTSDSAGQMHYLHDTVLEPAEVGNQLTLKEFSDSYSVSMGEISLSLPGGVNLVVSLAEVYPDAALLNRQTVIVPPFDFDLGKRALSPYADFDWLEVAAGTLRLSVQNNFAVPLGSLLRFAIYDAQADTLVVRVDHPGELGPGQTLLQSVDLSGKKFSNFLAVEISGSSPGSRNLPVLIDAGSSFSLNAFLDEVKVKAARARLGAQEASDSDSALIDDSVSIISARLKQGLVRVDLFSQLPIPATLELALPDFRTVGGGPVIENFTLNSAGNASRVLDISGYPFTPANAPLGQQKLRLLWTVRSPGSGNEYVTIRSSDRVGANFSIENVIFSEVSGVFVGETVAFDPRSYSIDVPEEIDSVRFASAQLELRLQNGIGFPGQLDLLLEGVNGSGRVVPMRVQGVLLPGLSNGTPVETRLVFDRNNSNVVEFVNALPTSMRISGNVTIGGMGYTGSVRDRDVVAGLLRIDAPLVFTLPAQRIEMDIESLDIDDEAREQIRDNLHDGRLLARLQNHLPMGASVVFHFGRRRATVYSSPSLVIGPIRVEAAPVENASGRVRESRLSEVALALSEQQLRVFSTAPLFAGVLIDFPGTNGQVVRVVRSDYLDIKAVASVNFTVDPESID